MGGKRWEESKQQLETHLDELEPTCLTSVSHASSPPPSMVKATCGRAGQLAVEFHTCQDSEEQLWAELPPQINKGGLPMHTHQPLTPRIAAVPPLPPRCCSGSPGHAVLAWLH